MNIGETIKEHPKATAAFVVVALLVLYLLFNGGSSAATTADQSGTDDAQVAAATQAYIAQQQIQAQSSQNADALTANQDTLAAQLAGTQVAAGVTNEANQLQAGVDLATINAQETTTDLNYTLSSQVQEASIAAQTQQAQIASNTTIGTAQTVANALVQESNNQAAAQIAQINAAEAVQTQSWVSKIF